MSYRPVQVTAWMLGHYQARIDDCTALVDIPLWDLDRRYLQELERKALSSLGALARDDVTSVLKTTQQELKEAYLEMEKYRVTIKELRELLKEANGG